MTRLETRTKESNIYASIWVIETHVRNESEEGGNSLPGAPSTDLEILWIDLSKSISVGTRKMVNFA